MFWLRRLIIISFKYEFYNFSQVINYLKYKIINLIDTRHEDLFVVWGESYNQTILFEDLVQCIVF